MTSKTTASSAAAKRAAPVTAKARAKPAAKPKAGKAGKPAAKKLEVEAALDPRPALLWRGALAAPLRGPGRSVDTKARQARASR